MSNRTKRRLALNLMSTERFGDGTFAAILDNAKLADALGVDVLVLPDHVAIHETARSDREGFPHSLDAQWFEPLTSLAAIAAVTVHARLSMNVLVAPLRPAVLLAKQIATLDAISAGRVEVALGAGWQREEFEATERVFDGRFGVLEEQIEVCRALWAGGPASHHGPRVDFDELHSYPLPPQGIDLPILLGLKLTERGIRRIGDLAQGWAAPPMPMQEFSDSVAKLNAANTERERLKVTAAVTLPLDSSSPRAQGISHPLDEALALWEAGADTVIVHPLMFCNSLRDLATFLEPLLEARDS